MQINNNVILRKICFVLIIFRFDMLNDYNKTGMTAMSTETMTGLFLNREQTAEFLLVA